MYLMLGTKIYKKSEISAMMRRYLWICLIIYFNRIGYYNHYKNYALLSLNFDKIEEIVHSVEI